jgi:predicted permease
MAWQRWWNAVRGALFRRAQDDRDLDDELQFHLRQEAQLLSDRGASIEDARLEARRAFGSVALAKERTRAVRVSTAIEQLLQDLRFGFRILTKSPALSATAVTLVALVIGGNTTIFSIAYGILKRPASGVHRTRLVTVSWVDHTGWVEPAASYAVYRSFLEHSTTIRPLLAVEFGRFTLNDRNGSYAVRGDMVSPNYFDALGVRFAQGRGFTDDENLRGPSDLVAVVSHRAWQDYMQGAPDVIGRPIAINGRPATIVGVVDREFRGAFLPESSDVWVPLVAYARAAGLEGSLMDWTARGAPVSMIGPLAAGASAAQAQAELGGLWTRLQATYPQINQKLKLTLVPYSATAGGNSLVSMQGDHFLAVFSVVTLLTLTIVCANVANLLIGRAVIRGRELALRQSLGASRVRIVRMLLAEGLVIALLAGVAALMFASWVARVIAAFMAPETPASMPDLTPDWTVAGYAVLLSGLAVVAFTLAPAIRAWRVALLPLLKAGEQGVIQSRSRLSNWLVVLQLAFSVLLLTCASLAYRSIALAGSVDLGFDATSTLLVTMRTSGSAGDAAANAILIDRFRERLQAVPGISMVSYARRGPAEAGWTRVPVLTTDGAAREHVVAELNHVGPDYLRTLGLSPRAGREFSSSDARSPVRSAVINQGLADALWPGQAPIGRTVRFGAARTEAQVVGVMPNAFFGGFRRNLQPRYLFLSAEQEPAGPGETTLYVRYAGGLDSIARAVRRSLLEVDSRTPVVEMTTIQARLDRFVWPIQMLTMLLTMFAGGSLLIAAIGQYAVVSFDMRRRIRECGVRLALGAAPRQIISSVVRETSKLTAIGLLIGFGLSAAVGRALAGLLYGVTPTDPVSYVSVFALLSVASLVACAIPARHAARVDPVATLRQE